MGEGEVSRVGRIREVFHESVCACGEVGGVDVRLLCPLSVGRIGFLWKRIFEKSL